MKITNITTALLLIVLALGARTAAAADYEGRCELFYKEQKIAEGACTASEINQVVSVKAVVEENGARYTAIIDNNKGSGVIIGCGAFTLADGPLSVNETTHFAFPNGYALRMTL